MGIVLAKVPYARGEGLASAFVGRSAVPSVVGGLAALTLVPWAGVAGLVVGTAGVIALAKRRIGGFTGDVLGAAGLIGETCGLVLAAAKW
jgi:adenosylcobinamide-GDP ribazoletransferase